MNREAFRGNDWPTLGVEVELQLVDARTMAMRGAVAEVLAALPPGLEDAVKPEFLRCYVEVQTDACRTVAEVEAGLAGRVRAVERAAETRGVRLLWAATHPFSRWRDQELSHGARYAELADRFRESLLRPVTFGLHVHVGVPTGDAAMAVANGLRDHLPALLALSANSPAWHGRATGLHAFRVELLEALPTGGLPPWLGGWADYEGLLDELAGSGFIRAEKEVWWDVRPSREHGTIEVRVCDMPPDLPSVLGLTALIQCLVHELCTSGAGGGKPERPRHRSLLIRQNRWRAMRYGLGAELVDPETRRAVPARRAILDLVDRLGGVAARLDCAPYLDHARAMAGRPNGSERQLRHFEESGDWAEVARGMVAASSLLGRSAS